MPTKNNIFKKTAKGALLMSILVSVGVMALIVTLTIPYLRKYQPNLKLNGVARELTTDLRYAQQLTITEQITHIVELNILNDSYKILKIGVATTTVKQNNFPPEVSFQQITGLTDDQVVFNSYGGVSESGEIILVNTSGATAIINVKPSGYVELQ
jgi:Tfp pilus assembly protein FimT